MLVRTRHGSCGVLRSAFQNNGNVERELAAGADYSDG